MIRQSFARASLALAALVLAQASVADEVVYAISGVSEPILTNVRNHVEDFGFAGRARVIPGQFDDLMEEARKRTREALKPYGYYRPNIFTSIDSIGRERWRLHIRIEPGPPVRVREARVELRGDGAELGELRSWRNNWPLRAGAVLNQATWERQKQEALSIAEAEGYLNAAFVERSLELDLVRNEADLTLVLDTGEQAVFGDVVFQQNVVEPDILEQFPRFSRDAPYRPDLVDKLRLDLWAAGYFDDIEVEEHRMLDQSPPRVDLVARGEMETRDTYQGSLGTGTDTGFRIQALWTRTPLSPRGDRLDLGIGYQDIDDQFTMRGDYRIPRRSRSKQFWVSTLTLRRDKQDLEVSRFEDEDNFIKLATGNVEDVFLRLGRLNVRDIDLGRVRFFETSFAQYLRESFTFDPTEEASAPILELLGEEELGGVFRDTVQTLAFGFEWDWPAVTGSGFDIEGHHERAWIMTSSSLWGSDRSFNQVYLSTRRDYRRGERWKLLVRAEVGYTDATVDNIMLDLDGEPLSLSLTRLPNQYRFKAGGSNSVRGYAFESLSNNDIGSNHIMTASAEAEYRVLENWSVAAFFDIGNAFNDWSDFELRKGAGIGVRWYTIAGAIRLDLAQALDVDGRPLRLHFTIGTPLL